MPRAVNRCPSCGEPVSQFAAGCAICGADLGPARRAAAQRGPGPRLPQARLPAIPARGLSADVLFGVILALVALFAPPFGLLLGAYMAYRFDRDGRVAMRNVAAACAVAALLFVLFPFGVYERVLEAIG
jgi:hypothetical protein